MYRPPYKHAGAREYEYVATAVKSLQGFVVALVFCLVNTEVLNLIRHSFGRRSALSGPGRYGRYSTVAGRTMNTSFVADDKSPYRAVNTTPSPAQPT
ncbi:hypothetical protein NP493_1451g01043 [Ridgeia piscesae]|uniref:Uncharacterized protein n=1 Tax=Ridgeia piscesae TaxID=27915 RepID=A0AAD9K222_RIDPI|nr:hypothetical protein NP493_1451g01043 [Ridgeia piscesae]